MNIFLILPNQLFEDIKILSNYDKIIIYEHPIYFTKYNYHKGKLILHRATMKFYYDYIKNVNKNIDYIEFSDNFDIIFNKVKYITLYNPIDHDIMKQLNKISNKNNIDFNILDNPNFLTTINDLHNYIKDNGSLIHNSFYIYFRKKLNIMIKENDKPIGNKWSFDVQNRLPFPHNFKEISNFKNTNNKYTKEAINYINKFFPNNFGKDIIYLPTDFKNIKKHLNYFLKYKLKCFGPYQDAMNDNISFGCHSILSPLINIGMINPSYIIKKTLDYANLNDKNTLISVEAFIRQLFWREYVMFVYMFHFNKFKLNHFKHNNKLDKSWFSNNPNTHIPFIDHLIIKLYNIGYLHHIERLMYVGNFLLLNKIKPNHAFNWFMMFLDSYPWVMYPNVMGMSQYSTGQFMMKRPYFSSSNYIHKMSSYKKKFNFYDKIIIGNNQYEWFEIWDALYYNFINNNIKEFSKNYSTANITKIWINKNNHDKKNILYIAKKFLN